MFTAFETATAEPEEFFESGDQVVAVVTGRLRHKDSSTEIENRTGHLWTIREGAEVSTRIIPQPDKALEAAGLSE